MTSQSKAENSRRYREERRKEAEAVGYTALTDAEVAARARRRAQAAERARLARQRRKDGVPATVVGSDEHKALLRSRWDEPRRADAAAKDAERRAIRRATLKIVGPVYYNYDPTAASLAIIEQANGIVADYGVQGYKLTLRQVFYKFVSRNLLDNTLAKYESLGDKLTLARYGGLMAMDAIEDRTRNVWESDKDSGDPDRWLLAQVERHQKSRWGGQPEMVEVWIEKDAPVSLIQKTCLDLRVPLFPVIGYSSTSEIRVAATRIMGYLARGQKVTILHLGDYDPSGRDMTRHFQDRLPVILKRDLLDAYDPDALTIQRIGLNMDQVLQHAPKGQETLPPNKLKTKKRKDKQGNITEHHSDRRAAVYIKQQKEWLAAHGGNFSPEVSWELDALEPVTLNTLIRDAVEPHIDRDAWEVSKAKEVTALDLLRRIAINFGLTIELAKAANG